MKLTASPTVLRFLTSSSGIFTSNFSSALTTMVIIEMESMSRSSVNDLSISTVSVAMPVSSLTSSARPARTSSVDCAMWVSFSLVSQAPQHAEPVGDQCIGVCVGALGRALDLRSGQADHLGAEDEAGPEADLQREAAGQVGVLREQGVGRQRDGGGRGVAGRDDVARDCHVLR